VALVVDYYPWLTARNTFSFRSIFSFLLFGLKIKAGERTIKSATNILAIIFSSIIGRVIYVDKDFFNYVQRTLIMLGFNSISEG